MHWILILRNEQTVLLIRTVTVLMAPAFPSCEEGSAAMLVSCCLVFRWGCMRNSLVSWCKKKNTVFSSRWYHTKGHPLFICDPANMETLTHLARSKRNHVVAQGFYDFVFITTRQLLKMSTAFIILPRYYITLAKFPHTLRITLWRHGVTSSSASPAKWPASSLYPVMQQKKKL